MADPVFIGVAVLTIGSAIISLETRELVYGAIALAISMMGIAGFFLLLDAPFVAMFQIAVYVGAVAVLVIFTVMLVRTQALFTTKEDKGRNDRVTPGGSGRSRSLAGSFGPTAPIARRARVPSPARQDRKSTRLNSSH